MIQKHGLGRGLASLIPQAAGTPVSVRPAAKKETAAPTVDRREREVPSKKDEENVRDYVEEVSVAHVHANTHQPRLYFDEGKLEELSASIKEHGILQPLIVVHKGDHYELIAGERRLRAAKKAGLATVPVIVKKGEVLGDQKKLELALIENIQRHDLNVIEEAKSYVRLSEEFGLSQDEISVRTGKSRSAVANRMRLIALPIEIQKGLIAGEITEGHAKVILSLATVQKQVTLYHMITTQKMTVRQAEEQAHLVGHTKHYRRTKEKTPQARQLEEKLAKFFGTKVRVSEGSNGGNFTVSYFSEEELNNILSLFKLS